jgi:hypothetical protein
MKFRFRLTQLMLNLSIVGVLTIAFAALAYFAALFRHGNVITRWIPLQVPVTLDLRVKYLFAELS